MAMTESSCLALRDLGGSEPTNGALIVGRVSCTKKIKCGEKVLVTSELLK